MRVAGANYSLGSKLELPVETSDLEEAESIVLTLSEPSISEEPYSPLDVVEIESDPCFLMLISTLSVSYAAASARRG